MVMELVAKNLRPSDFMTRKAFENAATVVAASGGSTNAGLHLPALAHECGIEFDLHDVAEIFKRTPYIADLKPGGQYVAKDMFEIGGVPVLMKALFDGGFLHGDCITVTGKTVAENLEGVVFPIKKVIYPVGNPITSTGGVVGLKGNPPGRRHCEGCRPQVAEVPRPSDLLRLRGGRVRLRREARLQAGRRIRHSL